MALFLVYCFPADSFTALYMPHLCFPNMYAKLQFIKYILIDDLIYAQQQS